MKTTRAVAPLACSRRRTFSTICEAFHPQTGGSIKAIILLKKTSNLYRSNICFLQELLEWDWQSLPHDTTQFLSSAGQIRNMQDSSQHGANILRHVSTDLMNPFPSASILRVLVVTQSMLQNAPQSFERSPLRASSKDTLSVHRNGIQAYTPHCLAPLL